MSCIAWVGDGVSVPQQSYHLPLTEHTNIRALNQILAQKTLDEILVWAHRTTNNGSELLPVTSFGPSGLVILHKMHQLGILDMVVTIDSLHLFPETYTLVNSWQRKYNHRVRVFKPKGCSNKQDFDTRYGIDLYTTDPKRYAYLSKVEPLQRAFSELRPKLWITGRRRSQGGERATLEIVEIDSSSPRRWKLNPLAFWSGNDVWTYIRRNNLIYNTLHDRGYTSIGDIMTTSLPTLQGGERSGRFTGMNQTECGIHTTQQPTPAPAPPLGPCTNCIDFNLAQLVTWLSLRRTHLLIEFHNPTCRYCRGFSITFESIAKKLSQTNIQVGRFDTSNSGDVHLLNRHGLDVRSVPCLYFIPQQPSTRSFKYESQLSIGPIFAWLSSHTGSNYL